MTNHARFTTLAIASIAAITLSTTHATAQPFIQIDVTGTISEFGSGGEFLPFGIRAIFDAGAAPDLIDSNSIHFNAVWGEAIQTQDLTDSASLQPFVVLSEPLEYIPAEVELQYVQSTNAYQMFTTLNDELIVFTVPDPDGAFSLAMASLPDAPGDYEQSKLSSGFLQFFTDSGSAFWTQNFSDGTILATIQVVDGPPEPECLVDLNNDGVLDFFDISTFLTLFGAGCP